MSQNNPRAQRLAPGGKALYLGTRGGAVVKTRFTLTPPSTDDGLADMLPLEPQYLVAGFRLYQCLINDLSALHPHFDLVRITFSYWRGSLMIERRLSMHAHAYVKVPATQEELKFEHSFVLASATGDTVDRQLSPHELIRRVEDRSLEFTREIQAELAHKYERLMNSSNVLRDFANLCGTYR